MGYYTEVSKAGRDFAQTHNMPRMERETARIAALYGVKTASVRWYILAMANEAA